MYKITLALTVLFLIVGCNNEKPPTHNEFLVINDDGNLKNQFKVLSDQTNYFTVKKNDSTNLFSFAYNPDIGVTYFINYRDDSLTNEFVSFHSNGKIESKLTYNKKYSADGNCFFFYPSGDLKARYFYKDGMKNGLANTYYDSTYAQLKTLMLYNTDGDLFYRKTFDVAGNVIKVEGEK